MIVICYIQEIMMYDLYHFQHECLPACNLPSKGQFGEKLFQAGEISFSKKISVLLAWNTCQMQNQNSFVGTEDNAHDTKAHPEQEMAEENDEPAAVQILLMF